MGLGEELEDKTATGYTQIRQGELPKAFSRWPARLKAAERFPHARKSQSLRTARARWERRFFTSTPSSAKVRPVSSGEKTGS